MLADFLDDEGCRLPFRFHLIQSLAFAPRPVSSQMTIAYDDEVSLFPRGCSRPFFLQINRLIKKLQVFSSRQNLPGVNLGTNDEASLNGDGVGSMIFELEADVDGDDDELPNGKQRRLVGRWLSDSQSSDLFKVAHAIIQADSPHTNETLR